jgi:hypothetical protein
MQRVEYAKSKSDAVAKMDGSWRKDKRTRQQKAVITTTAAAGEGVVLVIV